MELHVVPFGGAKKSLQIRKRPASASRLQQFFNELFDVRQSTTGVGSLRAGSAACSQRPPTQTYHKGAAALG